MYASNFFENKIMSLLLGGPAITAPSSLYVALFISSPGESGEEGTEISYTGYNRMPITFTGPNSASSGMSMENDTAITFAEYTGSGSNNVEAVGIFDNNNNMWLYGTLTTRLNVQSGVSPVFQAGSLKWTFSGNLSSYYRPRIMDILIGRNNLSSFNPYIALYNGDPNGSGVELSGVNYARMPVTFQQSESQPSSGALKYENASEIVSPTAGSGGWGTLTHVAIMDNSVGGNVFASMPMRNNSSYVITYGSTAGFHAGDLTFSIN